MSTPGPIAKLQRSFAYRVSRWFPSEMVRWMDAVSGFIDNFVGGGAQAQERWVNKGGSDLTGNGSFDSPFLTVQAAMNSITDASLAKPYTIWVSPGVYADPFTVAPDVYVVGSGNAAGDYNGVNLGGATYLTPVAAQTLSPAWAGSAFNGGGIFNAVLLAAFNANWATIGSTGVKTFILQNITTDSAISFVGSGNLEYPTMRSVYGNGAADVTLTNLGGSVLMGCSNDFGGHCRYVQSAPIQSFHVQGGCVYSALNYTWTSALISNFLLCQLSNPPLNDFNDGVFSTISGNGAAVICPSGSVSLTMPDSAAQLSFGNDAAGTLIGVNCALNLILATPTAARTLTITRPNTNDGATEILIQNLAAIAGRNIVVSFSGGTVPAGTPTTVGPGTSQRYVYNFVSNTWMAG